MFSEELKQIVREEKRRLLWMTIVSTFIAAAYSTTFIAVGLFLLPPFIGWLPFVYGFVNLGIALRHNVQIYLRSKKVMDAIAEMTIKLTEQGIPVMDAMETAADEVGKKKEP